MSTRRTSASVAADLPLALMVLGILAVLFIPIPPPLLDLLLLLNLGFALLLLLLTFHVEKPVQLSTFPSLLLIATLFRLALNIAATRLILTSAEGGKVIGAIGNFVVGGNYVIGFIVFGILVVIQYVVVTNGAQRVAEVAARFTLDSMPGQQMSIDADLNMGFIDQAQAQERRRSLEKEANFYGAMDGASKFVKGDAIAGIVILLVDIVGGWAVGMLQQGMKWDEALRTFTLLTVGDGIVTQVPALIIALATGIIVTRSGADTRLGAEVTRQLASLPRALGMVAMAMLAAILLPGMPALPVLALGLFFGALAWAAQRYCKADDAGGTPGPEATNDETLTSLLTVHPLEVRHAPTLAPLLVAAPGVPEKLAALRRTLALETGFALPVPRFTEDTRLPADEYEICVRGNTVSRSRARSGQMLAIHPQGLVSGVAGEQTTDPSYGLPAIWIDPLQAPQARAAGFTTVDALTVFLTHLGEAQRRHAADMLGRVELERLLEGIRRSHGGLVEELVPACLSIGELQRVLQTLLQERVCIRDLGSILEVLACHARQDKDVERLSELVRQQLGQAICQRLLSRDGRLHVLTLAPALEQTLAMTIPGAALAPAVAAGGVPPIDPRFAEQLLTRMAQQVERMVQADHSPVLLVAPELRRPIRRLTSRLLPQLSVIAMNEVPPSMHLHAFGSVTA